MKHLTILTWLGGGVNGGSLCLTAGCDPELFVSSCGIETGAVLLVRFMKFFFLNIFCFLSDTESRLKWQK